MIRNFFRFTHLDYCLPYSLQRKEILALNKPEEILRYSQNAIKEADPKIDKNNLSFDNIKLSLILNTKLNFTQDFDPLSCYYLASHPDFHEKFKHFAQSRPKNLTDVQKAIFNNTFNLNWSDKIQFTEIENYEELWHIVKWKQLSFLSNEESKWIVRQSWKIIEKNKLDLHYLCRIFELLCERSENFGIMWEHFDIIVNNYIHCFSPDEILIIMRGFSIKSHFILYQWSWVHSIKKFHPTYFDQFTAEQLFEYIELAECLKIDIPPAVIDRVKQEAVNKSYKNIHIWAKYKSLIIDRALVLELLNGLDGVSKLKLFITLIHLRIEKSLFALMIESLASDIQEVPITLLFRTSWLLYSKLRVTKEFYELLLNLEPRLLKMNFQEIIQLMDIFTKQKVLVDMKPEYLEKISNKILEFSENIDSSNICIISKFFCLMYPDQKIRDKICKILIESEVPDSMSSKRPNHQFFWVNKSKDFTVLNNQILVNMDFTRVLNIISSLFTGLPIPSELKSILNKYLKVLVGKCYFKLDLKFRIELANILATPEYFDQELFGIFIENVKKNMIYNNKPKNHKLFFRAIQTLDKQGHSDKELRVVFGLNS